ncbi:MAG: RNA-binding S4 domain-containing protein [Pseudomonadota bacterium]
MTGTQDTEERQRIDKWLWFSRLVKTRTLAGELVTSGKVRVNSTKVSKASHNIQAEDVLTFTLHGRLKIIRIVAIGKRRGPASEAQALYEDMSPPAVRTETPEAPRAPAERESGAGRPTKKERRDIDRWLTS